MAARSTGRSGGGGMRRIDREMPESFARMVLDTCEWATLSMTDPEGAPYGVCVNIVRDGDSLYFQSAKQGRKAECLRHEPRVFLSAVGETFRPPDRFTLEYESATVRGTAVEVTDEKEKIHALRLLCERYTPTNMANFEEAVSRSLFRTAVWRIAIAEMTGKRKKTDASGKELKFAGGWPPEKE